MLDYSNLRASTGGLSKIGGGGASGVGIPVHASLATTKSGRPLGVFQLESDFRRVADAPRNPDDEPECGRWMRSLKLAGELRRSCGTRVISVADREGDIWRMFCDQAGDPESAGLLVWACRSKKRRVLVDGAERQNRNAHRPGSADRAGRRNPGHAGDDRGAGNRTEVAEVRKTAALVAALLGRPGNHRMGQPDPTLIPGAMGNGEPPVILPPNTKIRGLLSRQRLGCQSNFLSTTQFVLVMPPYYCLQLRLVGADEPAREGFVVRVRFPPRG